ncbi:hypothetical protein [Haloarcula amylolytica]|uniref:hypothetical protein n=1 Tax=Haloarcula amylolytica TaxID=396317 RepID=UPI003C7151C8
MIAQNQSEDKEQIARDNVDFGAELETHYRDDGWTLAVEIDDGGVAIELRDGNYAVADGTVEGANRYDLTENLEVYDEFEAALDDFKQRCEE